METVVRAIVSDLGVNVATKKLVCKKFCEQFGQSALSPTKKQEIYNIINCIIHELVVNSNADVEKPRTPFCKVEVVSDRDEDVKEINDKNNEKYVSTSSTDNGLCESDSPLSRNLQDNDDQMDNVKENQRVDNLENIEINRTKERLSFHRKRLKCRSCDRDSLEEWNQNDDGVLKKSRPKSKLKRRFKRLSSKDVINLIMDSDNNADVSSEAEMSSPYATPEKRVNNKTMCKESPLVKPNQLSKKRRVLCISDSDDSETPVDCSKSGNTSDPQNQSEKNASSDGMSSEDSDSDFAGVKLLVAKSKIGVGKDVSNCNLESESDDEKDVTDDDGKSTHYTEVLDSKSNDEKDVKDDDGKSTHYTEVLDSKSNDEKDVKDDDGKSTHYTEVLESESNDEKDVKDDDDKSTHYTEVLDSKSNDEKDVKDDDVISTYNREVLRSCKVVLMDCCKMSDVDESDYKVKSKVGKNVDDNDSSDNQPGKERKASCSSLSSLGDCSDGESSRGTKSERIWPLSLPGSNPSSKKSQSGVKRKRKKTSEKVELNKKSPTPLENQPRKKRKESCSSLSSLSDGSDIESSRGTEKVSPLSLPSSKPSSKKSKSGIKRKREEKVELNEKSPTPLENQPRKKRKESCSSLSSLSDGSDIESSRGTEKVSPLSLPSSKPSSKKSKSGIKRKREEKVELNEKSPTSLENQPRKERKESCSSLSSLSDGSDIESSRGTEKVSPLSHPSSKPSSKKSKSGIKRKREEKVELNEKSSNKTLKSLRAICRHIGLILRNTIELKGCDTDAEKAVRIKELLHGKGMVGKPSMKSAEQFNLERELRELGGVNKDSGSIPGKGRGKRQRRSGFFPDNDSTTVTPKVCHDNFSHMKDIFCADDSSE